MWISKRLSHTVLSEKAQRGKVSMDEDETVEAESSVNERGIKTFSPYGYSAKIPAGEEIILIPSNDGQAAVGTRRYASNLASGEVEISSLGGAKIELKNDGRVIINSRFVIDREGKVKNVQPD